MTKLLIIGLLLSASAAFADGPLFTSTDTYIQQEFVNVYWDIKNPRIDSGSAKILTITTSTIQSLTVSTITAVSSATITNLTVTNINGSPPSSGKLIQTVSFTTNTSSSTVATAMKPTNITLSITPTSVSSKVKIETSFVCITSIGGSFNQLDLFRGTNSLSGGNLFSSFGTTASAARGQCTLTYLDSPSTTSPTIYTVYFASSDTNSVTVGNGQTASMILQEVTP